jgi:hypothetical protein
MYHGALGSSCCGYGYSVFGRRFLSTKEKKQMLEEYRDQLQKELAGVDDRIKEIKGD